MRQYGRASGLAVFGRAAFGRAAWAASVGAVAAAMVAGCGSGVNGLVQTAAVPVSAPAAVKAGPQLGYIWSEKGRTLRPVLGVPGSSQLGESVVTAGMYAAGAASAVSNVAVLVEADGTLDTMAVPGGVAARVAGTMVPGAMVRFSPGGLAAVAFAPGANGVTLLTGLGGTVVAATVAFGAGVREAAVSDDGTVAAAVASGSQMAIRVSSAGGPVVGAGGVAAVGGMTFVGGTDDLLVADGAANTVTLVRNSITAPAAALLPSGGMLRGPQGVGATRDGHWAVLANTGDAGIVRVDLSGGTAPQRFLCACQPGLVEQLAGTGVFRVTAADVGAAWMIDASAGTPRVLFIPASVEANAAETQKTGGA